MPMCSNLCHSPQMIKQAELNGVLRLSSWLAVTTDIAVYDDCRAITCWDRWGKRPYAIGQGQYQARLPGERT